MSENPISHRTPRSSAIPHPRTILEIEPPHLHAQVIHLFRAPLMPSIPRLRPSLRRRLAHGEHHLRGLVPQIYRHDLLPKLEAPGVRGQEQPSGETIRPRAQEGRGESPQHAQAGRACSGGGDEHLQDAPATRRPEHGLQHRERASPARERQRARGD